MRRGEGWALNPRDRARRALARDYVDSKRRVSEYYMYILVVLLAAVSCAARRPRRSSRVVLLLIVSSYRHDAHPAQPEPAGGRATARRVHPGPDRLRVMRALQLRRFRVPKPRVGPGDKI